MAKTRTKQKTKPGTVFAMGIILLAVEYVFGNLRQLNENGFMTAFRSLWQFLTQATDWSTVCNTFRDEIEWKFLAVTQSTRIQECLFLLSIAGILKVMQKLLHGKSNLKGYTEQVVRLVHQCWFWLNAMYIYAMYGVLPSDSQNTDVFLSNKSLVGAYAAASERPSVLSLDNIRLYDLSGCQATLPITNAKLIWDRKKPQVVLVCSQEFTLFENGRASRCCKTLFTASERRKVVRFADHEEPMIIEI